MLKDENSTEEDTNQLHTPMTKSLNNNRLIKSEPAYKKYRNAIMEIIEQNEILEHRTRTNRKAAQPFVYDFPPIKSSKNESASSSKKRNRSNNNTPVSPIANSSRISSIDSQSLEISNSLQSRHRRRINYSEELVDEAFMYEQILFDQQKKQRKRKSNENQKASSPLPNTSSCCSNNSKTIDSRLRLLEQRNEISIMPVKSRLSLATNANTNTNELKMTNQTKTEPLFNITSSVSVHIKPRKDGNVSAPNIQIAQIKSLHNKTGKIKCQYCSQAFDNDVLLAGHQVQHMKISAHKIDSIKILHPKLRRVSSMDLFIY